MPFSIGFNRPNPRRQANQDAARPAADPPAQVNTANAPATHPGFFQRRAQRRGPLQPELAVQRQRTAAGQAGAGAAAAPVQLTRRQLIAHWNEWAAGAFNDPSAPWTEHEARGRAVEKMKAFLNRGVLHQVMHRGEPPNGLNLSMMRLRSLPEHLPPGLQRLNLFGCHLTEFPASLPDTLEFLSLEFNRLTTLPDQLPESLRRLNVSSNQLTHLPHTLRGNLTELNVASNQLTALPATLPSTLIDLRANGNQLQSLPELLPASLIRLEVGGNQLRTLPQTLPGNLEMLRATSNQLTSIPSRLPPRLRSLDLMGNRVSDVDPNALSRHTVPCWVDLHLNPLSERSIERLGAALNAPGPQMVRVMFHRALADHEAQPAPMEPHAQGAQAAQPGGRVPAARNAGASATLGQAASAWAAASHTHAADTQQQWDRFAHEPGATAFSRFLDRLRGTVNFGNPQFKASVAEWLTHLALDPRLRHDTFALSEDATTSCEDRVSLTLNAMRQVRLAHDVEQGRYDQRLPELINLARGMFRLDQLEGIAREKAASLNFVDEIEVYLAYQVKLRESLALPLDTPDMRFFNISYVTPGDLRQAQARVLAAEQSDFSSYLASEWQPWQSVLQRLAPAAYEQAQEDLIEAMGDRFNNRLQARLRALDLTNDPDAQRTVGPQVRTEITREINGRLTRNFLASHGLLEHVATPGSTAASRPTASRR